MATVGAAPTVGAVLVPHQQLRATVGAAPKPQHSETMMEYAATCGGHADLAVKV